MKKISYFLSLAFMLLAITGIVNTRAYSEETAVTIPVSFSYSSTYWWRGTEFYGKGVGVLWPGAGVTYGDFSFTAALGISQDFFCLVDSDGKDYAKSLTELDLGAAYSLSIDKISAVFGLMYIGYPYYDAYDTEAVDPSFIEASAVVTMDVMLSPYVALYYDYYLNEQDSGNPVAEDYYVKVGVSHDLISTEDGFAFSLSGYIGYYNDPYWDMKGFSDAVAKAGIAKSYKDVSFNGGFYYGRTLGKDFKDYNGGIKNHFWADFGASMTF